MHKRDQQNHKKRLTTLYTWMISRYLPKMKNNPEALIQTVKIISQDIAMEFGMEKCAMQIMKSGKRETMEGIELPNQKSISTLWKKKKGSITCEY